MKGRLDDSSKESAKKTQEIKDLLNSIEKIEAKCSHYERENARLIETNSINNEKLILEGNQSEEQSLEIRSLR